MNYCVGCKDKEIGALFRDFIQTDYFRVVVVDDVDTVEVCGALKVLQTLTHYSLFCGKIARLYLKINTLLLV